MTDLQALMLGRFTLAGICFLGAALVASRGTDGWGWLIFAGILLGGITVGDARS